MRIALIADIHGNALALDAVLGDIDAQGGVDAYWFVGDYAAFGFDPAAVLDRITALPDALFLRGNTDRHTVESDLVSAFKDTPSSAPNYGRLLNTVLGFAWARGCLTAEQLDWLATLPLDHRATLPDGTRVLAVHSAPGRDDGLGITPATSEDDLRAMLTGCEADLVIVAHMHYPLDRTCDGVRAAGRVRVINTGSVSNPVMFDARASYALLTADADGHRVDFRRVAYDVEAAVAAMQRRRHPAPDLIIQALRGTLEANWAADLPEPPRDPVGG
jgi:predicted phosphodiesterase